MNTKKELKQIVEILPGYSFRTSIKAEIGTDIAVVQSKDISNDTTIQTGSIVKIKQRDFDQKFYLRQNDVLLTARGRFNAGLVGDDLGNAIASSSVYILRVVDDLVCPEYLAIFLNLPKGQKKLNSISSGVTIKIIPKNELENLKITIPDLKIQQGIIDLYINNIKFQSKLDMKKRLINNIVESIIIKLLK